MNPRRHPSIHRLLMLFDALAVLIFTASLSSLALLDWQRVSASHEAQLASGYQAAGAVIQQRLAAARLLAEEAAAEAQPAATSPSEATILVLGADGKTLSSSSSRSLPRLASLRERLLARPLTGVEVDDRGALVAAASVTSDRRIVVAALPLGPAVAQTIKDASGLEASLFAGRARMATTLRGGDGRPAGAILLPEEELQILVASPGRLRWIRDPSLSGRSYLQIEGPLLGLDGTAVGAYAVGEPWPGYWTLLAQQMWPWAVAMMGGVGLLLFMAWWLKRRLLAPVERLGRDLAAAASRQNTGGLLGGYEYAELQELVQSVNQLCAERATLVRSNERLNERLIQNQTLACLGQIAVGVAHDLNNPLTTIMGLASIIQTSDVDDDTRRDVGVIQRQAERSGSIVRSLLSFARRQRDEPQWVSLNDLISQTLELLSYQARINNVHHEAVLDKDLPLTWADPSQLQQVFFNLINNSLQAMAASHGRGSLRIESSWSPPTTGAPYGRITIRVRDDGPGIGEDVLPRLFQPYFTTKASSGGMGLGLTIASDIIKRHHGRIWAENNPRGGACFSVQMPVTPEPAQEPASQQPGTSLRRILLADSDPQQLTLLSQLLRREGYHLATAGDGLLARSKLEKELFDVVLCGLEMSRLGGRELYVWVRSHRPEMAGRFVFIVGGQINAEIEGFLQAARAWVLMPPLHDDEVHSVVKQALHLNTSIHETPGEQP